MAGNPIAEAVALLITALNELGIRYFAGGSVASSIHGLPRFTQDVDLVAELMLEQIEPLIARVKSAFYADHDQMREALRYGRSFNLIHLASGFKIDIFPLRASLFDASELTRSEARTWEIDAQNRVEIRVSSAEDTVLQKLVWYRQGGETSDRQWGDVLGIATTKPLDRLYMHEWALRLGVTDLLKRLFSEAGQIRPD